ncbi:hypothetical protein [Microbulbifer sp. TRSA005]|uniref:hypothetical protein n=1 Tax=Microbulbifer sp. TRSA005 TaxID=3243383 RepID=UPI004039779B
MSLKVGDWVRSYSSGIWQVYRIIDYKCLDPVTGEEQNKTTVFSKRFVSNSCKGSFKEECCDSSLVEKLSKDERAELQIFIGENKNLYEKYLAYEPKGIDCIYNARIGVPESRDLSEINDSLSGAEAMRDIDISRYLTELGYNTKAMPSWTVQFVSKNFSVVGGYLMFRFNRVLEY